MPSITSFSGETLLEAATLAEIKKQADLLLKQKDVAQAWQAASHIKKELSSLPADKISALLPEYRKISANLKALAFPLLDKEEAFNLIEWNLAFLSPEYLPALARALVAWLSLQENPQETREKLLKLIAKAGPAAMELKTALGSNEVAVSREPVALVKKIEAAPSYEMFNAHERDELTEHARKVNTIASEVLSTTGAAGVVEAIFASAKPSVDKESFVRRAQALIASRLRDVRTPAQLNEYLGRPFAVGGLGLEHDNLRPASSLIEQEYQKLHRSAVSSQSLTTVVEEKPVMATDKEPVLPSPPPSVEQAEEKKAEPKEISVKSMPAFEMPRDTKPAVIESGELGFKTQPTLVRARNLAGSDKSRVEDIKPRSEDVRRTLSAADELKLLTLADFRGWGNAAAAAGEVMRRVDLLTKESLGSKLQGIKQFRASELFKDYVRIGQQSLLAGKKLAQALSDPAINPNGLTEDEFFVLTSLNSKLK